MLPQPHQHHGEHAVIVAEIVATSLVPTVEFEGGPVMGNRLFQEPSRGGELALLEVEARQRVERGPRARRYSGTSGNRLRRDSCASSAWR